MGGWGHRGSHYRPRARTLAIGKVYKLKLREMYNDGKFDDQLKGTSVERF